jgi:allantoinase
MDSVVVRSERVVLPDGVRPASIYLRDGRIADIGPYSDSPSGIVARDAGDLVVIPGLVDTHVHINDPGRADWEGFETATRSAAAGGVTTLVDMPLNSIPATTSVAGLEAKRAAARGRCFVDVAFWGGVVPGNTRELQPLAQAGVCGFKCFLTPSGVDEFPHVTEADLREAMPIVATLRLPLLAHAELPEHLSPCEGDPRAYSTWLRSRPPETERAAVELLVRLALAYGTRVHIVHVASAEAAEVIRRARQDGVQVSGETCPHYLTFAAADIGDGATPFKCAPPIREHQHREALWHALVDGTLDLIATDHSPAPPSSKCVASGDFTRAWGGIASLQLGLAAAWSGAASRGISFDRLVPWMSLAPAKLAGLYPRKGLIAPGADADLVFWNPDASVTVNAGALHHRHSLTPYDGMTLRGCVDTTILGGRTVFRDGEVLPAARGKVIASAR